VGVPPVRGIFRGVNEQPTINKPVTRTLPASEPGKTLLCPLLTPNLECLVTVAKKRCRLHPFASFCFDLAIFLWIYWGSCAFQKRILFNKEVTDFCFSLTPSLKPTNPITAP
jgi:hypothetical protein